jgi:hypothetical protein
LWAVNNVNLASVSIPSFISGGDGGQQVSRNATEKTAPPTDQR